MRSVERTENAKDARIAELEHQVEAIMSNALRVLMRSCNSKGGHDVTGISSFLEKGGDKCPLCLQERIAELEARLEIDRNSRDEQAARIAELEAVLSKLTEMAKDLRIDEKMPDTIWRLDPKDGMLTMGVESAKISRAIAIEVVKLAQARDAIQKPEFSPDWATHPGEHLQEYLEARDITEAAFAETTGLALDHLRKILNRESSVTPEIAAVFEGALDVSASIWLGLQAGWDAFSKAHRVQGCL
jgi:addiction module HigA family antidote